jgi:hypothetical protein
MKLFYLRSGLHILAALRPPEPDAEPDDENRVAFSLLSLDAWGISFGVRICRVYTGDYDIDDFFDRALLGINLNHGRLILDVAFLRVMLV